MFNRVLIANRGAIATRIARTLKRLNIKSISVYAESDRNSLHTRVCDEAVSLGDSNVNETYLNSQKIIDIAVKTGAQAILPGYGFLSENSDFALACETVGLLFVGPSAEQINQFGLKHHARELAMAVNLPLLPGSALLDKPEQALSFASKIGYPVMLKSTGGGGGIGLTRCNNAQDIKASFDSVVRLGQNNFSNGGVFIEKFISHARHIEVQAFGDGHGGAIAVGERDCSSQRRNQKVIEETPAPRLSEKLRSALQADTEKLLASVSYRNIATVEYIVDNDTEQYYFLEVNTRLQVEHGVTEMVYGIDLVEWMLLEAWYRENSANDKLPLDKWKSNLKPQGHAIQARVYAEDPYNSFQPSAGLLSEVCLPEGDGIRVDHWIEAGIEVPAEFDPMLGKIIAHGDNREDALNKLQLALNDTSIYGGTNNIDYLRVLSRDSVLQRAEVTTRYLDEFEYKPNRIDVLQGGTLTTIQDFPGRAGYWHVGVPRSGPFDNLSFRIANELVGNDSSAAGIEITIMGPSLRFSCSTQIAITGAPVSALLDGVELSLWQTVDVSAGQTLTFNRISDAGVRAYIAVRGGVRCPMYLGSRATFTLGKFGGHNGRALRTGDVLHIDEIEHRKAATCLDASLIPSISRDWELLVVYGPHGAPDFLTKEDINTFFKTDWEVHYNSSRTGVRLIGPKPQWTRKDGGEAGLHPSNIHDNAYAFGTVDFTGDMPVILGPDGPSLGGFVCAATVIQSDLWKIGQLNAGDKVRFIPVSVDDAVALEANQQKLVSEIHKASGTEKLRSRGSMIKTNSSNPLASPIVMQLTANEYGESVVYRVAGDHFLLVEYGTAQLDIALRFRAHALMLWLQENSLQGILELTPGIRSIQIHYDSQLISLTQLLDHLKAAEGQIARQLDTMSVPSRVLHIPLSWDDPVCQKAIDKYTQSVRPDAPWCPDNIEFIRRINGLDSIEEVKKTLFDASYLVMGLGDVYLGAPVATPLDPSHRLVTTKYNPARTWTAENSVGIGGAYLCIYGMEGPGGYQFVGRTLQMWNRYRATDAFEQPWLLRFFDQLRFFEVSTEEMTKIRRDFPVGKYKLRIENTQFNLKDYHEMLNQRKSRSELFREKRSTAFLQELQMWHDSGRFHFEEKESEYVDVSNDWRDDAIVLDSSVAGSVWQVNVVPGEQIETGQTLAIIESMKMEIALDAPCSGVVTHLLTEKGNRVSAGQPLVVIEEKA